MALPPLLQHLRLPVIASPLFIISVPQLVIAQCKAGIVGSMPALNARPASLLDDWLAEITETLAAHDRAERARKPEIVAETAYWILNQDSRSVTGRCFVDEEVLRAAGHTDFTTYAATPGTEPELDGFVDS